MTVQWRNAELVTILTPDFKRRNDPAWTVRSIANVSDPPTDAELTAAIGDVADLPNDVIYVNDDNAAGTRTYGLLTDRTNNKWWRWKMYEDGEAMPTAGGGVSFAAPALTLGTSNAIGSSGTVMNSDATILAFDATVPTTLTSTTSAAAGSASVAARRDHAHAVTFFDATVPGTIVPDASAAAGSATVAARRDHTHGISTAAATTLTSTSTNTEGAGNDFARATHTHAITFFDATNPAQLTPDIAASAGSATVAARRDHVHNVPAATAVGLTVSSTSTEGGSTSFARANHTHAITTSSSPGAASQILKTDGSGILYLSRMAVGKGTITAGIELDVAGDIEYTGALWANRGGTAYQGYIYVPLATKLTSATWDGTASKGAADAGFKTLTTDFPGYPANTKAVNLRVAIRTTATGSTKYLAIGVDSSNYAVHARSQVSDIYADTNGICAVDASSRVYFLFGGTIENVVVEILGYFM